MSAAERHPPSLRSDWALSGLLLAGMGAASAGLGRVLAETAWWFVMMTVATIVLLAAAIVRSFARRRWWGSLAAAVAAVMSVTLLFAPGTAILGVIPTPDTVAAFRELGASGGASIAGQGIPAQATPGILYLLAVGVAVIAALVDALAVTLRAPALTGVPLLGLLLVPSLVRPEFDDGFFFALTAAAYLGIVLLRPRRSGRGVAPGRGAALGIGAGAVAAALILPLALPAPLDTGIGGQVGGIASAGLNPIISLGDSLRRPNPVLALSYSSSQPGGQYLRLAVLDDFSGESWEPTQTEVIPGNDVASIGAPAGLTPEVPTTPMTTEVTVGNVRSRWLPAPYAPVSVTGLEGQWSWEPDGLTIRTESSNLRAQQYTVESLQISPSIEQLTTAGTTVEPGFERYLQLPAELPEVVARTAREVAGQAPTNYEKAVALQSYFRSGDFVYSEQAPVDDDYDGSGASVLAAFLQAKSGYCVHFASAMAAMARTLGIPARVAVGFTPGQLTTIDAVTSYRVTTANFHAWPELYFVGIGWVRFEPTPGIGSPPQFAPRAADDPSTPDVDESKPVPTPTSTATSAPSLAPNEQPTDEAVPRTPEDAAAPAPVWSWVLAALAALLLAPAVVRARRRRHRLGLVERGSALAAWDELRDTAEDLGLAIDDARTPRQFSADLAAQLDEQGRAALQRLRVALEAEAFADREGGADADDVRAVIRSLRRSRGLAVALVSVFAPRSLVAGWLPAAPRP